MDENAIVENDDSGLSNKSAKAVLISYINRVTPVSIILSISFFLLLPPIGFIIGRKAAVQGLIPQGLEEEAGNVREEDTKEVLFQKLSQGSIGGDSKELALEFYLDTNGNGKKDDEKEGIWRKTTLQISSTQKSNQGYTLESKDGVFKILDLPEGKYSAMLTYSYDGDWQYWGGGGAVHEIYRYQDGFLSYAGVPYEKSIKVFFSYPPINNHLTYGLELYEPKKVAMVVDDPYEKKSLNAVDVETNISVFNLRKDSGSLVYSLDSRTGYMYYIHDKGLYQYSLRDPLTQPHYINSFPESRMSGELLLPLDEKGSKFLFIESGTHGYMYIIYDVQDQSTELVLHGGSVLHPYSEYSGLDADVLGDMLLLRGFLEDGLGKRLDGIFLVNYKDSDSAIPLLSNVRKVRFLDKNKYIVAREHNPSSVVVMNEDGSTKKEIINSTLFIYEDAEDMVQEISDKNLTDFWISDNRRVTVFQPGQTGLYIGRTEDLPSKRYAEIKVPKGYNYDISSSLSWDNEAFVVRYYYLSDKDCNENCPPSLVFRRISSTGKEEMLDGLNPFPSYVLGIYEKD